MWKCPICEKEFFKHGMHDLKHGAKYGINTRFGKVAAWNKGLTKETDERVRQSGIATSIGSKGKKVLTSGHREHISNGVCKAIVEKRLNLPKNSFGKIVEVKTLKGGFCRFRSLKEHELSMLLDADEDVVSFKYESLRIKYLFNGKYHITIPDFLIIRRNSIEIVEVKMDRIIDANIQAKIKLLAMKNYAEVLNWNFLYWNGLEFKTILE